jgi:hypothetical protein
MIALVQPLMQCVAVRTPGSISTGQTWTDLAGEAAAEWFFRHCLAIVSEGGLDNICLEAEKKGLDGQASRPNS